MPIHIAITRRIHPGKEAEFTEKLRRFLGESFIHGGVQGAAMMTHLPGTGAREIGILRTFADEADRDAFYQSALFREWEAYASTVTDEPITRELTGLEAWFREPGAPPRWKMAVASLLGVYPLSLLLSVVVGPLLAPLPWAVNAFVVSVLIVVLLSWVVMPPLTRALSRWLHAG